MLWGKYTLYFIYSCLHEVGLSCNLILNYSYIRSSPKSSNISPLTGLLVRLTPANSDVYPNAMPPVEIWWCIEVAQVWSHVCCSSSSSTTLTSIKTDDAIYSRTLMLSLWWSVLCVGMIQWHITDGHFQSFTRKWGHVACVQQRASPRMRGRHDYGHLHTAIKHLQYSSHYI